MQCTSNEQVDNERYLMQRNLMTINGRRVLTGEGRAYMRALYADGYLEKPKVLNNVSALID